MGKRCSLSLFCYAVLIAVDPGFGGQIEAGTEKDKARIRKPAAPRPARPSFGSANSQVEIISSRIAQVPGTNNGPKTTVVLTTQIPPIGVIMPR